MSIPLSDHGSGEYPPKAAPPQQQPAKPAKDTLMKHPVVMVVSAVLTLLGGNAALESWKATPGNVEKNGEAIQGLAEGIAESNKQMVQVLGSLDRNTEALTDAMIGRYDPVTHELLRPGLKQHLDSMAETQAEAARVHERNTSELIRVRKALESHGNLTVPAQ